MRAVIYARFSSDLQDMRSIDDQVALCRQHATRLGAEVIEVQTVYALTGATRNRPGLNALLAGARIHRFDLVVAEALDRLSRDQEDGAHIFKALTFADIAIDTPAEGRISELHIGLKGTMNALFLKDMAAKVRRGQAGRANAGSIPAGLAYGYEVVREFDQRGEPVRGKRRIVESQAAIVRRIFAEYAEGIAPREIARRLNTEGVPSSTGATWSASTILGHRQRRTGILCNELYIGRLVWNVCAYSRDPATGKRHERFNPEADWQVADVPDLRIVDQETWQRARVIRDRQHTRPERVRRPKRMLSGLVRCGVCGGPMIVAYKDHMACGTYRSRAGCDSGRKLNTLRLEGRILAGLKEALLNEDALHAFTEEFRKCYAEQGRDRRMEERRLAKEIKGLESKIERLVTAIADGTDTPAMRAQLVELEQRKAQADQVTTDLTGSERVVALLPNLPDAFRRKVEGLEAAIAADGMIAQSAHAALREMIETIVATPGDQRGAWTLEIRTRADALLGLATGEAPGDRWLLTVASPRGLEPRFTA